MKLLKFLLLAGIMLSAPILHAQALIKERHYAYKETDYKNCSAVELELNYPVFYSPSGKPFAMINDSVRKLIGDLDFYGGKTVSSLIAQPTDTTIIHADTADGMNCDRTFLYPETSYLSYTVFMNNAQLLSFSIEFSYHAGSGGHGAIGNSWSFCYDFKERKWISFDALFQDKFDALLLAKTDSIYLLETGIEAFDDSYYFTGEVAIKPGYLAFTYSDRWGAAYFYREINMAYAEYEKHLLPRYRELLKP